MGLADQAEVERAGGGGGVVGGMKFAEHVLIIRTEIINLKDDYC